MEKKELMENERRGKEDVYKKKTGNRREERGVKKQESKRKDKEKEEMWRVKHKEHNSRGKRFKWRKE